MQLRGVLALGALFALALALRLEGLDRFRLTGDVLHPYIEALRWLRGVREPWDLTGTGSSVRFGYGTWLGVVPLVAWADGLRELLTANVVVHTSGVLACGLAGRALRGWGAGLVAAGLFAVCPLLIDQPRQGAWTYQAPVAVAFAAWTAARLPRWRARFGVLLAAGVLLHPYAGAVVLGALAFLPSAGRRAVLAGTLVLSPMVVDNVHNAWLRLQMGEGAPGEVASIGLWEAGPAVWDAWWQGLSPIRGDAAWAATGAMALGLFAFRTRPRFAAWTVASVIGLVGVAAVLGYVQPYHVAVVLPLVFVAVGVGLASLPTALRWLAYAAAAGALVWAVQLEREEVRLARASAATLGAVERLSAEIQRDAGSGPRVLAGLADRQTAEVCTKAVLLDQWLAGVPDAAFVVAGEARAYVVAGLPASDWPERPTPLYAWSAGAHYELLAFDDLAQGAAWWAELCDRPGTYRESSSEGAGGVAAGRAPLTGPVATWSRCPQD